MSAFTVEFDNRAGQLARGTPLLDGRGDDAVLGEQSRPMVVCYRVRLGVK